MDYTPTGNPVDGALGDANEMRTEFGLIQTAIASKANSDSPTLTTPNLGVATATSINKITLTTPATSATLTIANGKTLTANKTLTLDGTDGTTITFPSTSASMARTDSAQSFAGTQTFSGLITAALGLNVSGAAFTSRGITDNATATALTLSGSGANSVTIANSAGNPTIGTSAGSLGFAPGGTTGFRISLGAGNSYVQAESSTDAAGLRVVGGTNSVFSLYSVGTGSIYLSSHGDSTPRVQVAITATASADRYITLTGSNGGNPTIGTSGGSLAVSCPMVVSPGTGNTFSVNSGYVDFLGRLNVLSGQALPAGGSASIGIQATTSNIGIYFGSGAPTLSAAQGSIYIRSDGGASTRLYSNNNGSTGWSAITSA